MFGLLSETTFFPRIIYIFYCKGVNQKEIEYSRKLNSLSLTGNNIFPQTRPHMIWQKCKYILDLVNPPRKDNDPTGKHISIEVHKCF